MRNIARTAIRVMTNTIAGGGCRNEYRPLPAICFLVCVMRAAPGVATAGSFSFSDNFEDGDISDWNTVATGTGVVEASLNRAAGGIYSMHIESIQNGDSATAMPSVGSFQNLDYSQAYTVGFDFNYDKSEDPNGFHFLEVMAMNSDTEGTNRHVSLYLDRPDLNGQADEMIYRDAVPANHSVAGLKEDLWYHLAVVVDPSSATYDLSVTGPAGTQNVYDWNTQQWVQELTTSDIPFMGEGYGGGFFPLRFGDRNADAQTYDHGEAYWDNIAVDGVWIPEPTSLSLFALGGLAMLQRRRRSC